MKRAREILLPDGSRRVGTDEAYLVFTASGDVLLGKNDKALVAERRSIIKGYRVAPSLVQALESLPASRDPGESEIISRLRAIICCRSQCKQQRLLDEFIASLKAACKLAGTDHKSNPHQHFDAALSHLAKEIRRVPTKGELAKRLEVDKYEISRLARLNGFSWLPDSSPGRPPERK